MSQRETVYAGLGDGRWEVRRASVWWLLQHPEPEDLERLVPLVRDPRSRVRHAALVALALAHAAREAEVAPLLVERALHDDSLRVRRQAVLLLAWRLAHPDLEGFFAGLVERERDPKLATYARAGVHLCRERAERTPC